MKKLFVGNLPFSTTEDAVSELFSQFGEVQRVNFVREQGTDKFRGFAFVSMDDAAADAAKEALNGQDFEGRSLNVDEAKSRGDRSPRNVG